MIALDDFGFGEVGIPRSYFEKPGSAIHLGNEPNRIDLFTKLKGISNDQIFANKKRVQFDSIAVDIIDYQDLIQAIRLSIDSETNLMLTNWRKRIDTAANKILRHRSLTAIPSMARS
jgi:hypothetical protein